MNREKENSYPPESKIKLITKWDIKYKGRYVEGPHPRDSNMEESTASTYWGEKFIDRKAKLEGSRSHK